MARTCHSCSRFLFYTLIIIILMQTITKNIQGDIMSSLIEVKNLCKVYKTKSSTVYALKDINLTVNSGDFTAIIGKSGSGKSTLMNMLGCLDSPTSGEYMLNGCLVSELDESKLSYIRNHVIGFVFQSFNLIPTMNAVENVELPLMYRGIEKNERRRLAINALETVELGDRINHRPCELSGGQQQRVAIARVIASSPLIILADEPTGSLDSKSGSEIMKILKELNNNGKTIVLITHDNNIAAQAKNRIHIHDGKIVK